MFAIEIASSSVLNLNKYNFQMYHIKYNCCLVKQAVPYSRKPLKRFNIIVGQMKHIWRVKSYNMAKRFTLRDFGNIIKT